MSGAGRCAIAVMAKAPRAGAVKTRLSPPLQPDEARQVSAAFLRDITENIRLAARDAPVRGLIAYAPAGFEALFDGHLAEGTGLILADGTIGPVQGVAGFGLCLLHAVRTMLEQGFAAACVLNSDSPTLPTPILCDLAHHLLRPGDRAVLGPAEDGGYYVLGMKQAHAHLFADIAWSTDQVAAQTRQRAAELGLELIDLPTWFDVDDRAALRRLLDQNSGGPDEVLPYAAPVTRRLLADLDVAARLRTA